MISYHGIRSSGMSIEHKASSSSIQETRSNCTQETLVVNLTGKVVEITNQLLQNILWDSGQEKAYEEKGLKLVVE